MKQKNHLKLIAALFLIVFLTGVASRPVMAQESTGGNVRDSVVGGNIKAPQVFTLQNPLKVNSIGALIQSFVEIVSYLAILLAVLAFIYVGFQYVTSAVSGNANKVKELRNKLLYLVIGVAVIIGARFIIQVVINTLSATGTVSPTVIDNANKAIKGQ